LDAYPRAGVGVLIPTRVATAIKADGALLSQRFPCKGSSRSGAVSQRQRGEWLRITPLAHNGAYWLIPARPGSARRSHHLPPDPPRVGPRHSPCSGWVPRRRLRALAGPGGCRGPVCSFRRYVGCGLPSPVPSHAAVGSVLRLQAGAGPPCPSVYISTGGHWPEGPAARWRSCRPGS
jgi:hypothetical protein